MPKGTLLYHGAHKNQTPEGPEWLAFEIEHAENFARSGRFKRPPPWHPQPPDSPGLPPDERPEHGDTGRQDLRRRDDDERSIRGYLHVYQASRDLNLLLIDGMSAGKTGMGTLDSQDLLLRENSTQHDGTGFFDEWPRALDICDLMTAWGYDGVVRMEIGFEVIHCNFSDSLDLVSMMRTSMPEDFVGDYYGTLIFEHARAVAERYDGLGGDRLRIDYSSMVSGLFFPINISSTDANRPDLIRLGAASLDELKDIKAYLGEVAVQSRLFTVNWQAVIDFIVGRFGKRLVSLAWPSLPSSIFINQVEAVTLTWYDAPPSPEDIPVAETINRTADAIDRCRTHFLRPAEIFRQKWSEADELIFTSIDAVAKSICQKLFHVRAILLEAGGDPDGLRIQNRDDPNLDDAVNTGRILVRNLIDNLGWSTWKQTQPCQPDETLFIAMWPIGDEEDHWNPGCRSIDQLQHTSRSYWDFGRNPPRRRPEEM